MADIFLDRLSSTSVRVQPRSAYGMLWLQTHFDDEAWDFLCYGAIAVTDSDAIMLSQDANLAGAEVYYP